jgi:hypothetical protein
MRMAQTMLFGLRLDPFVQCFLSILNIWGSIFPKELEANAKELNESYNWTEIDITFSETQI